MVRLIVQKMGKYIFYEIYEESEYGWGSLVGPRMPVGRCKFTLEHVGRGNYLKAFSSHLWLDLQVTEAKGSAGRQAEKQSRSVASISQHRLLLTMDCPF